jgi:cytochrome c biogenesis protein ResB
LREQLEEESAKKFGVPKPVAVEKSTAHLGNLGEKPAPARSWQQQQQQQPVVSSSTQHVNVNPVAAARSQFSQGTRAALLVVVFV